MTKKRAVLTVTVRASTLKRAFLKLFPGKTAQEMYPHWLKFWGNLSHSDFTTVQYVTPESPVEADGPLDPALLAAALKDLEAARLEREGEDV
jgi:hypothetical protein